MNKLAIKVSVLLLTFISIHTQAQSKLGLQHFADERWWTALSEFSKSTSEEDLFYKGICQFKTEDANAAATFNSIATSAYGKIGLGMLEMNGNNTAGAKKLFEEAVSSMTKNKNTDVFIAIARAITYSNATDKAMGIEWGKKAVDIQKTNADYRMAWGDAYQYTQDGGSAITQYEYAMQYAPTSAQPYAKVGQTYFRSKTYGLALENFNKAFEKNPNSLMALSYMTDIYEKYKKYDSATIFQNKLIELGEKNPIDMANLANLKFKSKDFEGAIGIITEIVKGDNKYNHLNRLIGYSYVETGKPAEAISFLEKFLETQPKEKIKAADYEYLGNAYIAQGDNEKGVATLKKSAELNPDDKESIQKLAETFKKLKNYPEAITYYKKVTEMPEPKGSDFLNLGYVFMYNQNYPEAEASFTKVIELSPNTSAVYQLRGKMKVYLDPEQTTASAKEDYMKFIEMSAGKEDKLKKQFMESYNYLAKIAIKNEDNKVLGKEYVDKALALDATNAEALQLLEFTK